MASRKAGVSAGGVGSRRLAGVVLLAGICCAGLAAYAAPGPPAPQTGLTDMIFFVSDHRIGAIRPDGTGECYPDFTLPEERHWRLGYVSLDGRWAEVSNLPFYGVQSTEPLKKWRYDLVAKTLTEISRIVGEALPGGERFLQVDNTGPGAGGVFSLFTTDGEGGSREDVFSGPGYAYGVSLSPDGRKVAYHITNTPGRPGYEIYVVDVKTRERVLIASAEEYLHFAPVWSPDSQWLVYQRCAHRQDPGHERSDVCLSRADGAEHCVLTTGQAHWFGATYAPGGPARCPSPGCRWRRSRLSRTLSPSPLRTEPPMVLRSVSTSTRIPNHFPGSEKPPSPC